MSRPEYLADHNLADAIVEGVLRAEPAVTFLTARESGAERLSDPELLELAANHGLIVVSHDRNTLPGFAYDRVRAGIPMAGVFIIDDQWETLGPTIDCLILIAIASEAEEWHGRVEYLPFS